MNTNSLLESERKDIDSMKFHVISLENEMLIIIKNMHCFGSLYPEVFFFSINLVSSDSGVFSLFAFLSVFCLFFYVLFLTFSVHHVITVRAV